MKDFDLDMVKLLMDCSFRYPNYIEKYWVESGLLDKLQKIKDESIDINISEEDQL